MQPKPSLAGEGSGAAVWSSDPAGAAALLGSSETRGHSGRQEGLPMLGDQVEALKFSRTPALALPLTPSSTPGHFPVWPLIWSSGMLF